MPGFHCRSPEEVPAPDRVGAEAAAMRCGVLKGARALGDRQALREAGRQVIHLYLGESLNGGLEVMSKVVA